MTLNQFLEVLAVGMPYTIGTENGEGWLFYYDGNNHIEIPDKYLNSTITHIYPREYREKSRWCCELKAGLAIVIEGKENGTY